jgi:hypothetical protein
MLCEVGVSGVSDLVRAEVQRRVDAGVLTGARLSDLTLLSQPHVCAWLGGHRQLSPAACDCVLVALRLSFRDLLDGAVPGPAPPRPPERVVSIDIGRGWRVPPVPPGWAA